MSDIEERKFYLQLWAFTTGPAIDAMHMYFEINVLNKTKLETFLDNPNNKHVLFHQCFPEISCCQCSVHSLASKGKRGSLESNQLKLLFDDTSLPQPNHEKTIGTKITQYCLCKYSSKCSIDIDSLDITLFYAIVQHCCPMTMNFSWRKNIKDVRNFLAHRGNGQVGKSDFEKKWKLLEMATLGFASELGSKCLRMFTKEIAQIKSCSIEVLKEILKESNDCLIKTLNVLNGLKQQYTETTESKNTLHSIKSEQLLQKEQLERMEYLLGVLTKQRMDNLEPLVTFHDSEQSMQSKKFGSGATNAISDSLTLTCEVESAVLDERKALRQIMNTEPKNDGKQFEVDSAEQKCLLLHLKSNRGIFKSEESLLYAIKSLIRKIVNAGEIDTSVESTMNVKLTLTSPVNEEQRKVICAMLLKYGDLNEKHMLNHTRPSEEVNFAIKTECISKTEEGIAPRMFQVQTKVAERTVSTSFQGVKMETDEEKYVRTNVADRKDSTSFHRVKMETSDEEKYDDIFVDVDNLKCLLKIKGLPNDLYQSEPEERPPDVKDTELLYVEWTLVCPSKWNASLISSNIQDNPNAFHDEFSIEFVYNESSRLIIHTTAQRCVFRSYSSLEVAVKNLLANILNVSNIKSTEPAELSASVLIMTQPEEEFPGEEFNTEVKTDQSIFGLKDDIVTCDHCTKDFSCTKCTSKMNHIRRLNQALKMKNQTIQRLERALTKREEDMIEEDKSDNESDYFVEKITLHGEPEPKKRKTAITLDIAKSKDASKSITKNESNILVDVKQALQKLAEIPLLDYYLKMYRTYLKDLNHKWIPSYNMWFRTPEIKLTNTKEILNNLLKEKKKRTKLISKLVDVIHNQDEFTTTDEAYDTDIQFLNVGYPTTKCNYCHANEDSQISCYCKDCQIFICDNCVIEHRMKNKKHNYSYQPEILRGYKLTNSWELSSYSRIIDWKLMAADIVAILLIDKLCTYNLTGKLINIFSTRVDQEKSRIARINDCKIAVTVPSNNLIQIFTILSSTTLTDLRTPEETEMTGGITCKMDILYVAFSDAIRSMDLSGQIHRVVNIPNVNILHSVIYNKILCVYSKDDSEKTMSCLDCTNYSLYHLERFPFHPKDVTTDDIDNIIFIENGVIWLADSDGKNIRIIRSSKFKPTCHNEYEKITYDKDSKSLLTYHYYGGVNVFKKLE